MALHVLQHGRLRLVTHAQAQDRRVETLVVHQLRELRVIEQERARVAPPAIENRRDLAEMTQAAARTLALVFPELGDEFERSFHVISLPIQWNAGPRPGTGIPLQAPPDHPAAAFGGVGPS